MSLINQKAIWVGLLTAVGLAGCAAGPEPEAGATLVVAEQQLPVAPGADVLPQCDFPFRDAQLSERWQAVAAQDPACLVFEQGISDEVHAFYFDRLPGIGWAQAGGTANAAWFEQGERRLNLVGLPYAADGTIDRQVFVFFIQGANQPVTP